MVHSNPDRESADGAGSPTRLIMIAHPCDWSFVGAVNAIGCLVVALVFAVLFAGLTSELDSNRVVAVLGAWMLIIAGALLPFLADSYSAKRCVVSAFESSGDNLERVARSCLGPHDGPSLGRLAANLRAQCRRRGVFGAVVTLYRETEPVLIAPLQVPFEPIALDESLRAFREIADAAADSPNPSGAAALHQLATAGRPASSASESTASESGARFRRRLRMGQAWIAPILAVTMLIGVSRYVRTGQFEWGTVVFATLFIISVATLIAPIGVTTPYFLVNGGLVRRKAPFFAARCELHLFRREESVLIVAHQAKWRWFWMVFDKTRHASQLGTRDEAIMLLCAWLSPLPPPDVTRMDDLK